MSTAAEIVDAVRRTPRLLPIGGGTKPALARPPPGFEALSIRGLSGMIEYEPGEYTFTALAGTPIASIAAELEKHGQYLPFDPPFAEAGSTLGGAIAAGMSGSGRVRYGGIRDFILGVRFVTGKGELVRGGGKVVKNAAGFDIPKLLVGSIGRLGIIVEATFKVFPHPRAMATVSARFERLSEAVDAIIRLGGTPFDVEALEFEPPSTLHTRIGGLPEALAARADRLTRFIGGTSETVTGDSDRALWTRLKPTIDPRTQGIIVKIPLTPPAIPELDRVLEAGGARRRYSGAGSLAWVEWPGKPDVLDTLLRSQGLPALVLAGEARSPLLGAARGTGFLGRIKAALDPSGRFPDFS